MSSRVDWVPYLAGNFQIVNTTVLNTIQIGDDDAAFVDVLNIFSTTTIGSAANNRNLTVNGRGTIVTAANAAGVNTLTVTPGAHTAVIAEVNDILASAHTMTITGGFAVERFTLFARPTVTSVGVLTIVDAATVAIANAPAVAGAAVITNAYSLWVQAGLTFLAGGLVIGGPLTVNKGVADTVSINGLLHTGADDLIITETRAGGVVGEQRAVNVAYTSPALLGLDALGDIAALYVSSFVGSASDVAGGLAANYVARHDAAVAASRVGYLLQNAANYGGADGAGIAFDGDNAADIGTPAAGITAFAHRGRPRTIYAGTSFVAGASGTLDTNSLTFSGVGNITAAGISTWANGAFVLTITGGPASIYEALNGALTVRTRRAAAGAGGALALTAAAGLTDGAGGAINVTAGAAAQTADGANVGGAFTFIGGAAAAAGGILAGAAGGGFTFTGGAGAAVAGGTGAGGGFSATTGAPGLGGAAGSISILTGAPGAGTRGAINIGDANVGTITIGNAASASAVTIASNAASGWTVTDGTLTLTTTVANNIRFVPGSAIITTSATALTADAALTITATAAALGLTGGTTATVTASGGNIRFVPSTAIITTSATALTADAALTITATGAALALTGGTTATLTSTGGASAVRLVTGSGTVTSNATLWNADAGFTVQSNGAGLGLTGGTTATLTASGGDVTITPSTGVVAIGTAAANVIQGAAGQTLTLRSTAPASGAGTNLSLTASAALGAAGGAGGTVAVTAGAALVDGAGGAFTVVAGNAVRTALGPFIGGAVSITAGNGAGAAASAAAGGAMTITGGNGGAGSDGAGGDIIIQPGDLAGAGANGVVRFRNAASNRSPDLLPRTDNEGNVGVAATRWALVRATTITSGDIGFDDPGCAACGKPFEMGQDLALRVMRQAPDGAGRVVTYTQPVHYGCKGVAS